jgi:hypothetical protein
MSIATTNPLEHGSYWRSYWLNINKTLAFFQKYIVPYLINALPGNSSLITIRARKNRTSCVFRESGSWRKIGDVTQHYVAVTWHVSCVSVSLRMCGDVTQQRWVGVTSYVFTVGRCRSLDYRWAEFLSWQVDRNSNGGSTRGSELEVEVAVTVSDRVLNSEFLIGDSHGKFVFEKELTCELKTLCVL